jgi:hypothetical protein
LSFAHDVKFENFIGLMEFWVCDCEYGGVVVDEFEVISG